VQRPLKLVKHLLGFGWKATVLTVRPEDASYPDLDPTLVNEIPKEIDVFWTRAWDPYTLYASMLGKSKREAVGVGFVNDAGQTLTQRAGRWFRANVFLPDARVGWVPFASRMASRLMKREQFDAVVTTGPPHSTHFVGRRLRRRYGIPWIADFRDPWTDISYYGQLPMTEPSRRLDAAMERSVLLEADAVVSVSNGCGALLKAHAELKRYETIYNGFDALTMDTPSSSPLFSDRFVIAHIGTLAAVQHVAGLVEALARRIARDETWKQRLKVLLVGTVDDSILTAFGDAGLRPYIELVDYVPHQQALEYMRQADILFVSIQQTARSEGILTGKIFEYLSTGVPVLGFAPVHGDLALLLKETEGGEVCLHTDTSGIEAFLDNQFKRVIDGTPAAGPNHEVLRKYDRREQTRRFAELLDEVVAKHYP